MQVLRRVLAALFLCALAACTAQETTTSQNGTSSSGGDENSDAGSLASTCAGEPCDGICAADLGRLEAYCAPRCGTARPCQDPETRCTALQGETVCLKPYVPVFADGGSGSSSSSGGESSSEMPQSSSEDHGDEEDAGPGDDDEDAGVSIPDGGYSPIVWLTNRCHLGRVEVNTEKACTATFTSVSDVDVLDVSLAPGAPSSLRLMGRGGLPHRVSPGDAFSIAVVAHPATAGSLQGTIVIRTPGGNVTTLMVTGDAVTASIASTARPVVRSDGRALLGGAAARPNSLIALDGTASLDETGAPATVFAWRLIQMPMGSPAVLAAPTEAQTLVVPINGSTLSPGTYVAGLRVGDSAGALGPEEIVSFEVATQEDFVVELTWDQKETDLDLVLFKGPSLQPMFTAPDACQPSTCLVSLPGPRWDGMSSPRTGGNPVHQGNVTTGFGPERIVIAAPVPGAYVVGVRYTGPAGRGSTTALVRVLYRGKLIGQARKGLNLAQEWVAFRVTLPTGQIDPGSATNSTLCTPRCTASQQCVNGQCQALPGVAACSSDAGCGAFEACISGRCVSIQDAPRCLVGCPAGTRCLGDAFCVADAACSATPGPLECLGGECNAVGGTCLAGEPGACVQDACESGLMCTGGVCRECGVDADCGFGLLCDGVSGRCVSGGCLRDDDCGPGRLCDRRHGGCLLAECTVDVECQPVDERRRCDLDARRCYLPAAVCANDMGEPDNDTTHAVLVGQSAQTGTLCRSDVDYLRIRTQPQQLVKVTTVFTPSTAGATSGITAELRASDGRLVAGGVLGTGQDRLELAALTGMGGDMFLVLGGFATAVDQWSYTVTTVTEPVPPCVSEAGEPNDTFAQASNSSITPGAITRFLCTPDDEDHHQLSMDQSHLLRAKVTFNANDGDIRVSVLGLGGAVRASKTATTSPVVIDYQTTMTPETVAILVESATAPRTTAPRAYTLETNLTYVPNCLEDVYETVGGTTNNTQNNARQVTPGVYRGVACSATDEDWFKFRLPAAGPVEVRLEWAVAEDFLDLTLRNSGGQLAASSTSQPEVVTLSNIAANVDHAVQVRPKVPAGATFRPLAYTLTISAPSFCADDAVETAGGDDTAATSQGLRDAAGNAFMRNVTAKICQGDADWYRVAIADQERIRVSLNTAPAGTRAQLYAPDGTTLLGETTPGGAPVDKGITFLAGNVFIKVLGDASSAGTYELGVVVQADQCTMLGAETEPNDSQGTASSDDIRTPLTAAICPTADVDFYRLDVTANETVEINAAFDGTQGDIDLRVRSGNALIGEDLDVDTAAGSEATVTFTAMTTGTVFVEVIRKSGMGDQVYVLSAGAPPPPDAGVMDPPDAGEPDAGP